MTSIRKHRRRLLVWGRWARKIGPAHACTIGPLRAYERWARAYNSRQYRLWKREIEHE